MKWFFGGRTGYAFFDVWSIVHFCFWLVVGSGLWSAKVNRIHALIVCLVLAYGWEVFERYAEKKWPNLWLNPESWWNSWISDPLMAVLGLFFIWYALDNWRIS
jgi:hypothetical protein